MHKEYAITLKSTTKKIALVIVNIYSHSMYKYFSKSEYIEHKCTKITYTRHMIDACVLCVFFCISFLIFFSFHLSKLWNFTKCRNIADTKVKDKPNKTRKEKLQDQCMGVLQWVDTWYLTATSITVLHCCYDYNQHVPLQAQPISRFPLFSNCPFLTCIIRWFFS